MKIGILTFHWATNYGAILQAYCLQEFLKEKGHSVEIINYKPRDYDYSLLRIIKHPSLIRNISREYFNYKKDFILEKFRNHRLNRTRRYFTLSELSNDIDNYDIIISGSDQVLSHSFTLYGENGKLTPVYWLKVGGRHLKRVGYAVSFGCEEYPEDVAVYAKDWVNDFYAIGTREQSGQAILNQLGYIGNKSIVPDPTVLLGKHLFEKLDISLPAHKEDYICVFMLRHEVKLEGNVKYIDEKHTPYTMDEWLSTIIGAGSMITNSYHGMLVAIYAHVPFAVILETGRGCGMNDRFYTLLNRIGCENRLANNLEDALKLLDKPLNFKEIDEAIIDFRMQGDNFIKENIK